MPAPRTLDAYQLRKGDVLAKGDEEVLDVYVYAIVTDAKGKRRVETFQPRAKVLVK